MKYIRQIHVGPIVVEMSHHMINTMRDKGVRECGQTHPSIFRKIVSIGSTTFNSNKEISKVQ